MSEKFEHIKGIALLSDPSAVAPGYLTGGQNFVKRQAVGLKRRPGFGAFDVESAAAISVGATSPRAVFPFSYYGADPDVMGFANGLLNKYDGVDSFDQVTKNITDAIPTVCSLGEYGIIASGGRVLKYGGTKTPSPIGAELIADMESDEIWATAGTGTPSDDTDNELTGLQCKKGVLTVGQNILWTLNPRPSVMANTFSGYSPFSWSKVGDYSVYNTNDFDKCVTLENEDDADVTVYGINFGLYDVGGTPSGDVTIRVQRTLPDGTPDGTDVTTGTFANASFIAGLHSVDFAASFVVEVGEKVAIIYDLPVQSVPEWEEAYLQFNEGGTGTSGSRSNTDGEGGTWSMSTNYTIYTSLLGGVLDLSAGYSADSKIKMNMFMDDVVNFAIGANSYIKFIVSAGVTEATYQFVAGDLSTVWKEISLIRGVDDKPEAEKGNSDFVYTGTMDWSAISSVEIKITSVTGTLNIYLDTMFLLHEYAPTSTDKVSRADNRVWPIVGNRFYYSDQYTPNNFSVDAYIDFADNGIGAAQAGIKVVCVTESESHVCTPLEIMPTAELASPFVDYDVRRLNEYGGIDPKAVGEMSYKGRPGAYWITKNRGVMFYDGETVPQPISAGVQEIFTKGRANTTDFDYSRSGEVVTLFHPRWNELWIFYPTLITNETNLTYALVMDCDTGEWMPVFVWANTAKLIYASVYRDSVDGFYKLLLTDTDGSVWKEGFVGDTALTSATSRDGYVDGSTKGSVVVPYIDTWWFHGEGKSLIFHNVETKFIPNTIIAMELNVDYRVADIGSGVVQGTYPREENVVYGSSFTDLLNRTFTAANASDVYQRNLGMGKKIKGQAIAFRIGMQDIVDGDADSPELEIVGISVKAGEQGGRG